MSEPRTPGLFEPFEPPPGGLGDLRRRIGRARIRQRRVRTAGAGLATLALAGLAILLAMPWSSVGGRGTAAPGDAFAPAFRLARMRLGTLPAPAEPVTIPESARAEIAAVRVLGGDDRVVYYRIASLRGAPPDPEAGVDPAANP